MQENFSGYVPDRPASIAVVTATIAVAPTYVAHVTRRVGTATTAVSTLLYSQRTVVSARLRSPTVNHGQLRCDRFPY